MDMKELLTKTSEEITQLLAEAERDEQDLRRKLALRTYTKNAAALTARRQIARLKTVLSQKKHSTTV